MSFPDITPDLRALLPELRGTLEANAPLAPLSWFRTGGPAQVLFSPSDADDLASIKQEAANCFLKTLEEPPPRSVILLIGTSADRQLPTIVSRCQVVNFGRLAYSDVAELFDDVVAVFRAERADLAALGCRYVQLDEVALIMLADPDIRRVVTEGRLRAELEGIWTK